MKKPAPHTVSIVDGQTATRLSPAQQSFNTLIDEIGKRRARLQEWETASDEFHKKYSAHYLPLEQELLGLKRQAVYRLHDAWSHKALGKGERITLSALIADMVYEQVKTLPEPLAREVLDFVGFLRERRDRGEWRDLMNAQATTLVPIWDNAEDKVWDDA